MLCKCKICYKNNDFMFSVMRLEPNVEIKKNWLFVKNLYWILFKLYSLNNIRILLFLFFEILIILYFLYKVRIPKASWQTILFVIILHFLCIFKCRLSWKKGLATVNYSHDWRWNPKTGRKFQLGEDGFPSPVCMITHFLPESMFSCELVSGLIPQWILWYSYSFHFSKSPLFPRKNFMW